MSRWVRALKPANSNVTAPMVATVSWTVGASENSTWVRAMRYTPAVTIVAAWINALTGVGPAIASGSHVWSGNWADLPIAPPITRNAITPATAEPGGHCVVAR